MNIQWSSLKEGDEIPELIKKPGVSDLVRFAAGNGDFNPLHHDYNCMTAKAIGSILVQGHYKQSVFGQLLTEWLGHSVKIQKISCKHTGMDFPDNEILFSGMVKSKIEEDEKQILVLNLWAQNSKGEKTTVGTATVVMN